MLDDCLFLAQFPLLDAGTSSVESVRFFGAEGACVCAKDMMVANINALTVEVAFQ